MKRFTAPCSNTTSAKQGERDCIAAELVKAVLAWWDKHVRDSGQLDSLSDRMVALAREFQKAKEE